jgi:hypothetical protein
MSLSLRSALPTLLVYGLSSPAAAPGAPIRQSLDDTTALATFEASIPSPPASAVPVSRLEPPTRRSR